MTNEELTAIYNEANGLNPSRHNPITTERIFAAMRAAMAFERRECAELATRIEVCDIEGEAIFGEEVANAIMMRSNVKWTA